MNLRSVSAIALLTLAAPLMAAEEDEGPWAGKATLGYLATSGNTENSTLNTGFEIGYSAGDWKHLFNARAINTTEDDATTAEAYEAGWKSERDFAEHNYLFGALDWRKDRFSGYETQFSQTAGYGRRLVDTETHKLNAEIGGGARQSELSTGSKENEFIARFALDYTWQMSENAAFEQKIGVEAGSANTYVESITRIFANLGGVLSLVASYTVKNNSDVPPLTEKTDTYTALSLEYTF